MRERLRTMRLVRALRAFPSRIAYACWARLRPVRPRRVLFLSDSHGGFDGSFGWLRDALHRAAPDLELLGVFKPSLRARRPLLEALRLPYLLATSAVILLDDFYPLVYGIRLRPGSRLVQLWHAAGAFKRVGHSRAGLPGGPPPGSEIHRNYTDVYVSSEAVRDDYAEAFGVDRGRVRALGVPRTDFFFDPARLAERREAVRQRYGVLPEERLVLVAPTFRGNGQRTAAPGPAADWGRVAASLGEGWRIALREHPFVGGARPAPPVIDAVEPFEMPELLVATDVLVTDYSSVVFEFALLRRPVVLFVPDLAEYAASRSFYRPFDRYAIGPVVGDAAGLPAAIRGAEVDPVRFDAFLAEFCGALDGRSTARIVEDLLRPMRAAA